MVTSTGVVALLECASLMMAMYMYIDGIVCKHILSYILCSGRAPLTVDVCLLLLSTVHHLKSVTRGLLVFQLANLRVLICCYYSYYFILIKNTFI
jgi:hypothetical protein